MKDQKHKKPMHIISLLTRRKHVFSVHRVPRQEIRQWECIQEDLDSLSPAVSEIDSVCEITHDHCLEVWSLFF